MTTQRIAVLSDIHSNPLALDAVLAHIKSLTPSVTGYWCLGDILGRGHDPLHCIQVMSKLYSEQSPVNQTGWLAGNHDWLVLGKISSDKLASFNMSGLNDLMLEIAVEHNRPRLEMSTYAGAYDKWLRDLPTYSMPLPGCYMIHAEYHFDAEGQVRDLFSIGAYSFEIITIGQQLKRLRRHAHHPPLILLNGHTHVSVLAVLRKDDQQMAQVLPDHKVRSYDFNNLEEEPIYLNPGSVGFPRYLDDQRRGDYLPTYAVLTMELAADNTPLNLQVEFHEVPYDWQPYFNADGSLSNSFSGISPAGQAMLAELIKKTPLPV